jgi:peptide methionine sulfoxide reductase MsrA
LWESHMEMESSTFVCGSLWCLEVSMPIVDGVSDWTSGDSDKRRLRFLQSLVVFLESHCRVRSLHREEVKLRKGSVSSHHFRFRVIFGKKIKLT